MSGYRRPGPIGCDADPAAIDEGTLCRAFSPPPGSLSTRSAAKTQRAAPTASAAPSASASRVRRPPREFDGPLLARGSTGDEVVALQKRLNVRLGGALRLDGIFGEKTKKAVLQFQWLNDLRKDGIVGPKTREALPLPVLRKETRAKVKPPPPPEPPPARKPAAPPPEEPVEQLQIVSVGFADRSKSPTLFSGTRAQYVNLTSSDLLSVDKDIVSANQLGRTPPIAVKVSPPQSASVTVRIVREEVRGNFPAGSENNSAREAGHDSLTWQDAEKSYTTDGKGELLIEPGFKISVAAGWRYRAEAWLADKKVKKGSNTVEVKRRVYLQPVVRYATGRKAALDAMSALGNRLSSLNIDVIKGMSISGDELGVTEQSWTNLSDSDLKEMGNDALSSADNKKKKPHGIAVIIGEFLATDLETQTFEVELSKPSSGVYAPTLQMPLKRGTDWYVLVPLTDGSHVVKCKVASGFFSSETVPTSALTDTNKFTSRVTIDLREALKSLGSEDTLTVSLKVKVIRRWAVGWAYPDVPVIYLNLRDPNTDSVLASNSALPLLVHELGHKLHLAASGSGDFPDKQPKYYPTFDEHGVRHQGPHCSTGVASGTDLWKPAAHNAATCVMWGSLKTNVAYCPECCTSLRKMDLSAGF